MVRIATRFPLDAAPWQRCPLRKTLSRGAGEGLKTVPAGGYAVAFGQVVLIQFAAAVDSLWLVPGFGQPIGAGVLGVGVVMMRSGARAADSCCGRVLLRPVNPALLALRAGRLCN